MRFWSVIKSLSESKLSSSSAIWIFVVPAIAKISDAFGTYNIDGINYQVVTPLSFMLLYFSAILFFFGGLVYVLFCPDLIKNTKDYSDFKRKGMNELVLSSSLSKLGEDKANEIINDIKSKIDFSSVEKIDDRLIALIEAGTGKSIRSTVIDAERVVDAYWIIRAFHDKRYWFIQLISIFSYGAGSLILLFIVFSNLFTVISHI
jgi:hypothetical protein